MNKQIITEATKQKIYQDYKYYNEKTPPIKNINELHDITMCAEIGETTIEKHDYIYWKMVSIIETEGKEIIKEINNFIRKEMPNYYPK